jgi:hypothetical protein
MHLAPPTLGFLLWAEWQLGPGERFAAHGFPRIVGRALARRKT